MSNTNKWVLAMVLGVMAWGTALAQPANNTCATAANMTIGTSFTSSNMGATTETVPACPGTVTSNHTVWYRFTGNGADVTLTTCGNTNFDTQIQVFSGTCAALVPVACNNNDNTCSYLRASTVEFTTGVGTVYYVRIGGVLGARGTFTLSSTGGVPPVIGCNTGAAWIGGTVPATGAPVTFSTCFFGGEYAPVTLTTAATYSFTSSVATDFLTITNGSGTMILGFGTSPLIFNATAGGSFRVYVHTNGQCGTQSSCRSLVGRCTSCTPPPPSNGCTNGPAFGGGTIQTDGNVVVLSTCYFGGEYAPTTLAGAGPFTFTSSVATDFLTVTNATGTMVLAFGNSPLVFDAPAAGAYRVYVHTNNQCGTQSACRALRGRFTGGAPSDFCATAVVFTLGETVIGTNEGATTETVPSCFDTETSFHTVWYRFTGNGANIVLSTCGGTDFDSQIEVFTGTCTSLTSVACNNNDSDCGFTRASTVAFQTTSGTVYYVRIGGVLGARGNFTLTSTIIRPENSDCEDAISLSCGSTVTGSTVFATVEPVGFCGTSLNTAPGVWYTLEGNGDFVRLETCGSGFDTKLGVFTGSCGAFTCVTGNDDACGLQSRAEFESEEGVTYYILVTGFGTAQGSFTLSVTCITPEPGCNCVNTAAFGTVNAPTNNLVVNISTLTFASEYNTINNTVAGRQYTFTSSNAADFLTVRAGTPSGEVLACGPSPLVVTATANGPLYLHVNTNSFCGTQNTFRTTAVQCSSCAPPPPIFNDLCTGAINLACGDSVEGSTIGAGVDAVSFCGTSLSTAPGVWYSFVGTGDLTTVSLCGSPYDTKVGVFSGACGAFTCVAGNDDFCGLQSQVTFTSQDGIAYYVLVTGFGTATGTFTLNLTCTAPPPPLTNDNCAGAITLTPGTTCSPISGSIAGSTQSIPGISCDGFTGTADDDVWYKFVATAASHNVILNATFDAVLDIRSGACNGTTIGCADANTSTGIEQVALTGLTVGTTYHIRLYSWSSVVQTNTTFTICVTTPGGGGSLSADITPGAVQQDVQFVDLNVGELYPNPARAGQVFVDIATAEEGVANIQVFDQVGRIVLNTTTELYGGTNKVVINADKLATGTYFATIRVNDELVRRKLVVIQ